MRVTVPWNDAFPQFQIVVRSRAGVSTLTVDDSHREVDVPLPEGVDEDDVEITGRCCGRNGQPSPLCGEILIKAAVEKPKPQPKAAPVARKKAPLVEPEPTPRLEPIVATPAPEGNPNET